MIIITGAAGFIGSNLVRKLNLMDYKDLLLVDDLNDPIKNQNIKDLKYKEMVGISDLWQWEKENNAKNIETIFHLGACTNTLEKDANYLYENNVVYSQRLWGMAVELQCKFIYASSAATYGNGSLGFSEDPLLMPRLCPLNLYGRSKQDFDLWILEQKEKPKYWIGLKYFNVFGPGEAHKEQMASVVWHFIQQINRGENLKLFSASHGYEAGEQKRDFIYIEDALKMTLYGFINNIKSGIYNVGTGKATSFNELGSVLLKKFPKRKINYMPFPDDLMNYYQAYTCAEIKNFLSAGLALNPYSLETSIELYWNTFKNR